MLKYLSWNGNEIRSLSRKLRVQEENGQMSGAPMQYGDAVAGGAIGTVVRWSVARGVFSNATGVGSAPIAAVAAKTNLVGLLGLSELLLSNNENP